MSCTNFVPILCTMWDMGTRPGLTKSSITYPSSMWSPARISAWSHLVGAVHCWSGASDSRYFHVFRWRQVSLLLNNSHIIEEFGDVVQSVAQKRSLVVRRLLIGLLESDVGTKFKRQANKYSFLEEMSIDMSGASNSSLIGYYNWVKLPGFSNQLWWNRVAD